MHLSLSRVRIFFLMVILLDQKDERSVNRADYYSPRLSFVLCDISPWFYQL